MYAIVNIAGKQFKVSVGDQLRVPSLESGVGEKLSFDHVLLTDDGKSLKVGSPTVKGASIFTEVLGHGRDKKVLIYKKKRRKGYQRKNGHRQGYTMLEVKNIKLASAPQKTSKQSKKEKAVVKKGDS